MKPIKKSILINAPKEKVWEVLTRDEYTRQWYAEFSEGSHAETDWKVGSKAIFKDNSGFGMITKVVENTPGALLELEYTGVLSGGKEDYTEETEKYKGGRERYELSEENGQTRLNTSSDIAEEMYDSMDKSWDKALQKLKEVAEK